MQTRQTCNSFSGPKSYRHVRETGATGLKTGVKNDIFWSEIGSGFERTQRYTPTKNSQEYPLGDLPVESTNDGSFSKLWCSEHVKNAISFPKLIPILVFFFLKLLYGVMEMFGVYVHSIFPCILQ